MQKFKYVRDCYSVEGGWENEAFFDENGITLHTERRCFIDALQRSGLTDVPFDSLSLHALEIACIANNIYVIFEDMSDDT